MVIRRVFLFFFFFFSSWSTPYLYYYGKWHTSRTEPPYSMHSGCSLSQKQKKLTFSAAFLYSCQINSMHSPTQKKISEANAINITPPTITIIGQLEKRTSYRATTDDAVFSIHSLLNWCQPLIFPPIQISIELWRQCLPHIFPPIQTSIELRRQCQPLIFPPIQASNGAPRFVKHYQVRSSAASNVTTYGLGGAEWPK